MEVLKCDRAFCDALTRPDVCPGWLKVEMQGPVTFGDIDIKHFCSVKHLIEHYQEETA